jgi:signal transduction histidine kinase
MADPRAQPRPGDLALLAALGVVLAAVAQFGPFLYASPLRTPLNPVFATAAFIGELLWVAAAMAAYWRDPSGPMWKLLLASRAVSALGAIWVVNTSLTWTVWEATIGLGTVLFAHLVLAFPSGRLVSRYDRWLVIGSYAVLAVARLGFVLVWDPRSGNCFPRCPVNPFLMWPSADLAWLFGPGLSLAIPLLAVLVAIGLARRWLRASPALRRMLLPVALVAPLELGVSAARFLAAMSQDAWQGVGITLSTSPLAFLHAAIPAGFLLGILAARLARGAIADLAVELSRGVPLGGLRDALARALRDPTLALAFPAPGGVGWVDPHGQPIEVPADTTASRSVARLERDGQPLAALLYDPAIEAEDPGRLGAVSSVASMALENERLAAQVRAQLGEVRASRSRIVEAADAERRRIERDLHDGAQQRLVALAMRLDQARGRTADAGAIIDRATEELLAAIREVRDLAHGLHPPILTERGVAAAVEALAERTTLPVRVSIPPDRLPADVEAAAYFLVAESLTNAAKHAGATAAEVRATLDGGVLHVTVSDDGRGGADASGGTGLVGLVDRLAAIGGTLAVESPPGGGTTLQASIPLGGGAGK